VELARLAGKVTVISGAGSGIGKAGAYAFAREGATVGLLDRNAEAIERVAADIGPAAFPLACDVTDEAQVVAAFEEVRRRAGRLDVLYTCAAVQLIGEDQPVHELPVEVWERTQSVNMRGVFLTCKHGARLMIESGSKGSIINTGSPTGQTMAGATFTAYSASKAGVMGLTRVMAADLAGHSIRVNGIVPGSIVTELTARLYADPVIAEQLRLRHPIGRYGQPEDLDGIALFLASDESSFATGSHFYVDGGMCVR
jgi:NAD(P)-dependent dehydrogenase (short-subunit alcohol dehydrogenase family)